VTISKEKRNALVVVSREEAAAAMTALAEWIEARGEIPPRDCDVAAMSALAKLRKAFGDRRTQ
jgi:hypothetical protein